MYNFNGGNNDNFVTNPNQNYQQINQTSNPNMYNSGMMGYPSGMKPGTGGGMQKPNESMGYGSNQSTIFIYI